MAKIFHLLSIGLFLIILVPAVTIASANERPATMSESKQYFVRLLGTRPDWPENMTADEQKIMEEHYYYLVDLIGKNKVLMAGPCFDPVFGLIVLQVESEKEAREIMDREPSVVAGVHTYDLDEMRVSLRADYQTPGRYVPDPSDRILRLEKTIPAPVDDVWEAWTTEEGIKTFFAPDCRVELRMGGPFEIYFDPGAETGKKGADDSRILNWMPNEMLTFDWNTPLKFGKLRQVHTRVIVQFRDKGAIETEVILSQVGWGNGPEWDPVFEYFTKAWDYVLNSLEKRFKEGPIDWSKSEK